MEPHERMAQLEAQARSQGEQAFHAGRRITDCPHREHTREAELWRRAFANARLGAQMNLRGN
jgi:hypothetical protein